MASLGKTRPLRSVLERERWGVPPIGAVKSEGSAGGGGLSTVGAGISSAYSQWSGLGCLLAAEVMEVVVGGAAVDCGGVDGCGDVVACGAAFGEGRVAQNGVDVGLCVSVAVVWAWSGLLGFMRSWRGDHTVSLGGGVTVFWAWSGLLLFMKCGRGDHKVGLLGAW